ncbi:hypothetical protein DASC09_036610 [Saccharomycopsis crataegensis]|uniref:Spindle pole body-associated protein Vik1/Cik1 microtubule binding domain-containing protein n=1 Tax=Saccharomycopsis crataegensis TaxID=43959 RepID=A0AAV5QNZ3_9ASCO|nr:hypothetical protein DASC09_036610 [Saccharomycopsis crataegensis]
MSSFGSPTGELRKPKTFLGTKSEGIYSNRQFNQHPNDETMRLAFGHNKKYIQRSPVRSLGSPMRLSGRKNPAKNLSAEYSAKQSQTLTEYYSTQIEKREKQLYETLMQIKDISNTLNLLYSEKSQLKSERSKLKKLHKDLSVKNSTMDQVLNSYNEELNNELQFETDKLSIEISKREATIKKELYESEREYDSKISKVKELKGEKVQKEIDQLNQEVIGLQQKFKEYQHNAETIIQEKKNHQEQNFEELTKRSDNTLNQMREQLDIKRGQLSSTSIKLSETTEKHDSLLRNIEVAEEQIKSLMKNESTSKERNDHLNEEILNLRNRHANRQKELDDWEVEFDKWRVEEEEINRKLKEQKYLKRKTQFAVQGLLEKLSVYVRILADGSNSYEVNNPNDGMETLILKETSRTYCFSKIVHSSIDDDSFCEEFDNLMEEGLKSFNNSIIMIGDRALPFPNNGKPGGLQAIMLLYKNFDFLKRNYFMKLKPRGWNYEFSFQFLTVSVSKNSFKDMIESNAGGANFIRPSDTTISIGSTDVIAKSNVLKLSLTDDNSSIFEQIASVEIPQGMVSLLLLHMTGENKGLNKFTDSTSYILDFTTVSEDGNSLQMVVSMFNEVLDHIKQNHYSSKLYQDSIFIKQLLHSFYANTESITMINIEEKRLNSKKAEDLLLLGEKINQTKMPPKKRAVRSR